MTREQLSRIICNLEERQIAEAYQFDPARCGRSPERTVRTKRKRIITLALAAALILSLGIAAYATGFVSAIADIARSLSRAAPDEATRRERPEAAEYMDSWNSRMEELIDIGESADKTAQRVELGNGTAITLTESYYDGEQLALSYVLNRDGPSIDYSFGPEHEYFALLHESEGLCWYEDLSTAQYLEILAKRTLKGKLGFVIRTVDVGDHVSLSDGTDIGPFVGGELDGYRALVPQNGLPDAAKGRDRLELVFRVKTYEAYIWLDGDRVYSYYPVVEGVPAAFEIVNNTAG